MTSKKSTRLPDAFNPKEGDDSITAESYSRQPNNAPGQAHMDSTPQLIRYANSAQGVLAQRDPAVLRRFLLDACDPVEQLKRQNDLFRHSTSCLTLDRANRQVVNAGLFAWPMTLCMSAPLRVRSSVDFEQHDCVGFKTELSQAFALALDVPLMDVNALGLVDMRHLVGIDPLTLQFYTGKQANQWSRKQSHAEPTTQVPDPLGSRASVDSRPSLPLSDTVGEMVPVGRNLPVAYLLLALVRWPLHDVTSAYSDSRRCGKTRLQNLLEAFFTHAKSGERALCDVHTHDLIRPHVRLGTPKRLNDATTQAQGMQLAWMAERARKTDCRFELEHRQVGSLMAWSATLTDTQDEVVANLEYAYDGFWRPHCHVQTITEQVSLAQATGQMCAESPNPFTH